ncbi:uncharacterized protein LOC106161946 isoform X2 [Lingula anatina]|uniref:Uncharacterized protein LOC106161946 isoform X2 n=1 Tax=Lingula anatina TaxID=7574 RepID=A0A1S3I8F6_LINAN|nr:uncharacterized protein LOC106161946 isoform X2 [Lingula anatina]|eukprot:XP_013394478.1 uncharacterized protein LOC106161946 isoform X2 [Lingula anatina]
MCHCNFLNHVLVNILDVSSPKMNLDDILRSFFGIPGRDRNDNRSPLFRPLYEDDEEDDFDEFRTHFPSFGHGSGIFRQFEDMFRQMEEEFRGMGIDRPGPGMMPGNDAPQRSPGHLRDYMLKQPDEDTSRLNPTPYSSEEREDKDLDADVRSKGLDAVLRGLPSFKEPPHQRDEEPRVTPNQPSFRSFGSSSSFVTIRGADGKIEQRKTVRDSEGNEETTVIRQIGDKTHTIITHRDKYGREQVQEDYKNIEGSELPNFDSKWQGQGRMNESNDPRNQLIKPEHDSSMFGRGFLSNIFEKFYSKFPFKKDDR